MRDHSFHEVQVDYQNAEIDYQTQTFRKRGTFEDIEQSISAYKDHGVTALYLHGVFERDNVPFKGSAMESYNLD